MLKHPQASRADFLDVVAAKLLADNPDDEPSGVAARAVIALERLAHHVEQLVGATGVGALLARSIALASVTFPWLKVTAAVPGESPLVQLRLAIEAQDGSVITAAFALLLATFVGLLGRLIGEGLVTHLLHDVWPGACSQEVKESS